MWALHLAFCCTSMHRFLVPPEALQGSRAVVRGEPARQMSVVLRMKPGEQVALLDGRGVEYLVRLITLGKDEVTGELVTRRRVTNEPSHAVDIFISLLNKSEKVEWVLQKCTELGASRFVPVMAERSVAEGMSGSRRERWQRIIREAVEQSGRGIVPSLEEVVSLDQAIRREGARLQECEADAQHLALMPAPRADLKLRDAIDEANEPASASIFIGPEGGFTDDELFAASEAGIQLVSLGPRILRSETAAIMALALLMQELGELG